MNMPVWRTRPGDTGFADMCRQEAKGLQLNIEQNAWDGQWYRRAYFDDGTPLGSHVNPECTTDSISQSWSVLSEAGEKERSLQAMQALNQRARQTGQETYPAS